MLQIRNLTEIPYNNLVGILAHYSLRGFTFSLPLRIDNVIWHNHICLNGTVREDEKIFSHLGTLLNDYDTMMVEDYLKDINQIHYFFGRTVDETTNQIPAIYDPRAAPAVRQVSRLHENDCAPIS